MQNSVYAEAMSILRFASSSADTLGVYEFLSSCAELYLIMLTDMYGGQYECPTLPRCSGRLSALVDLASGPGFVNLLHELTPTTAYYAVDTLFFVAECIRLKAAAEGLRNVVAVIKDIIDLQRTDIQTESIGIIRAKNIFTYVPNYLFIFRTILAG